MDNQITERSRATIASSVIRSPSRAAYEDARSRQRLPCEERELTPGGSNSGLFVRAARTKAERDRSVAAVSAGFEACSIACIAPTYCEARACLRRSPDETRLRTDAQWTTAGRAPEVYGQTVSDRLSHVRGSSRQIWNWATDRG